MMKINSWHERSIICNKGPILKVKQSVLWIFVKNRIMSLTCIFFREYALNIFFVLFLGRCISRNLAESRVRTNCASKNWPRSLWVLSIPRVKILDSKVCYRRTCERDDGKRSRGDRHSRDFRGSQWLQSRLHWISSLTIRDSVTSLRESYGLPC